MPETCKTVAKYKFDTKTFGKDKPLLEIMTGEKFEEDAWPENIKKMLLPIFKKDILSMWKKTIAPYCL